MNRVSRPSTPTRTIYLIVGWSAVALGLAGVFLPGLPTTVFVIVGSYCFSRSSPRFERWLRANRWLGPTLERFEATGGMSVSAKRTALTAMWIAILLSSALLLTVHWAAAVATVGLGVVGTASILFGVRTASEHGDAPSL